MAVGDSLLVINVEMIKILQSLGGVCIYMFMGTGEGLEILLVYRVFLSFLKKSFIN